ncbi:Mss4-like protein [Bisporella sp. PMI_857]|nr:Mss4-like protein [Bisporella sp. PMI_857]
MADIMTQTYKGNCHCGAFQFSIEAPEIKEATECNCSLCHKKGYLWIFPPKDALKILKGDGSLVSYQFGNKTMTHKFCPTCGTGVMIERHSPEFSQRISLNVRTLLGLNPFSLEVEKFDGKARFQPPYTPPPFTGELPTAEIEGSKVYSGGCHCGAVRVAVKTKPLPEIEIKEDNCSICQRNANIFMYPNQSQVSIVGEENTTDYLFGRKWGGNRFCKTCGVVVYSRLYGPPKEIFDSWSDARKAFARKNFELLPIRVRTLNDVEWDQLEIKRSDEGTEGYTVE